MAFFGKDGSPIDARLQTADGVLSIIASGMRVVGDIEGPGLIKIDGRIEGAIAGARQIILGRDGVVHGNVHATEAILAGTIDGALVATERAELQATAVVNGDIHTRVIVVHEGAQINGTVRMGSVTPLETERETDRPPVQMMR